MIRKIALITGLFFIVSCFGLPLSYTYGGEEDSTMVYFKGFECESFFINLLLVAGILCSSFIGRGSYTAFFIVLGVVGGFLVFMNSMKHVVPGLPWGYYVTIYQYMLYVADVMVVIAAIVRIIVIRKQHKT